MVTTVKLINIHLLSYHLCVTSAPEIYSQLISSVQHTICNYTYHAYTLDPQNLFTVELKVCTL